MYLNNKKLNKALDVLTKESFINFLKRHDVTNADDFKIANSSYSFEEQDYVTAHVTTNCMPFANLTLLIPVYKVNQKMNVLHNLKDFFKDNVI